MPDDVWGSWVKTAKASSVAWAFPLSLQNMDDLLLARSHTAYPPIGSGSAGVSSHVSTFGCQADMSWNAKAAQTNGPAPGTWSAEEQAAWTAWVGDTTGLASATGFLYKAYVTAGIGGSTTTDYELKVFGWVQSQPAGDPPPPPGPPTWRGDTYWTLNAQFSVENVVLKARKGKHQYDARTSPRRWTDEMGRYLWFATPSTQVTVTLGGLSATQAISTTSGPDGEIEEMSEVGGALGTLTCIWDYHDGNYVADTDYVVIGPSTIGGQGVNPRLECSLWYSGGTWVSATSAPGGATWHLFNSGATLKLQNTAGATDPGLHGQTVTFITGPMRWNNDPGRFGFNTAFALATGMTFDNGLEVWTSETEKEAVYLAPGLSGWYVGGYTHSGDAAEGIKTGMYDIPASTFCKVKESWLTANGELLSSGVMNNRYGKIALHSIAADPSGTDPFWGPALTVAHADLSVDIPPGEAARPTNWMAGAGASIDGGDNTLWTISAGGGTITRTLVTRYWLRLDYMQSHLPAGSNLDPDWPLQTVANENQSNDIAAWGTAVPVEDVTDYDNSRLLKFTFTSAPEGVDWSTARLTLAYRTTVIVDPCYSCFSYRFGQDGDSQWAHTPTDRSYTFLPDTDASGALVLVFDLAQLSRTNDVHLQHVTGLTLVLPEGEYNMADVRLYEDASTHGYGSYTHLMGQQATDPWNWASCKLGYGSTYEGMPHLNIANGTEHIFTGDVERGIHQTQYAQHCPTSELTDDPTAAVALSRIANIINWQEQLTATYGTAAVNAATVDADTNSLGTPYPWDLKRAEGDENNGLCALSVKTIEGANQVPFADLTINGYWITHGRAQGMKFSGATCLRGTGGASDNSATYSKQFHRRPAAGGSWTAVGSFEPEPTGRWRSPPALEEGYVYSFGMVGSGVSFVTRQYAYGTLALAKSRPCMWVRPVTGICHLVFVQDGDIRYTQSDAYSQATRKFRGWRYGGLNPVAGSPQTTVVFASTWTDPAVVVLPTGEVIVSAKNTDTNVIRLKRSKNQGETWSDVPVGTFVTDLTALALWQHRGVLQGVGIVGTNAVFRRSDDGGTTASPLDGSGTPATSITIGAAADEQPAIIRDPSGPLYATINTGSALVVMVSSDGGNTWANADTV